MIRWTTPTLTIGIPEGLVFDYLLFTLTGTESNKQINKRVEFAGVVDNVFTVTYTQEETGSFEEKEIIKAQINFMQGEALRYASNKQYLVAEQNLIDEVIA